jgi:hypothetical protein
MGALNFLAKMSPEAMNKLTKAFIRYDIGLNDSDVDYFDPHEYANDIKGWVSQEYKMEDMPYVMDDVIGAADIFMEEGTIDEVIDSIRSNEPDGFIQQLTETYADPGSKYYDEQVGMIHEAAADALTYYRDNWLGYHADDILEMNNRLNDPKLLTDYESILNNRPIVRP